MNLKTITAEIDKKIANLNQLKLAVADLFEASQVNGATRTRKPKRTRTRRVLSPTARAAISAAQKARWAKYHKAKKAA